MSHKLPLLTERLILRDFVASDILGVHNYAADSEVVRYLPFGPNSEQDSKNFLRKEIANQRKHNRQHFAFAIVSQAENKLLGSCRITISDPTLLSADIGYCIAKEFWGKGYATEAVKAVICFGFQQLGLHRINAFCDPENKASARVLIKTGMRQEGLLREFTWLKGEWHDSLLFALLQRELMQMQMREI